jgi:hypothetical protein
MPSIRVLGMVCILASLPSIGTTAPNPKSIGSLETNITAFPTIRYNHILNGGWEFFGSMGSPEAIVFGENGLNICFGTDWYPFSNPSSFYVQFEMATLGLGATSPPAPVLSPGVVAGFRIDLSDAFFTRLGLGLGFPIPTRTIPPSDSESDTGLFAAEGAIVTVGSAIPKIHLNFGAYL